jgi:hypothetical protein
MSSASLHIDSQQNPQAAIQDQQIQHQVRQNLAYHKLLDSFAGRPPADHYRNRFNHHFEIVDTVDGGWERRDRPDLKQPPTGKRWVPASLNGHVASMGCPAESKCHYFPVEEIEVGVKELGYVCRNGSCFRAGQTRQYVTESCQSCPGRTWHRVLETSGFVDSEPVLLEVEGYWRRILPRYFTPRSFRADPLHPVQHIQPAHPIPSSVAKGCQTHR